MSKADERQDAWVAYPLGLFTAALRSIVGGLVVVVAAIFIGTWCGDLVWHGDRAERISEIPLMTCGVLVMAGIQFWGWLYLLVLAWLLYYLIHDEGSRVLAFGVVVPLQTSITILNLWQAEWRDSWTTDQILFAFAAYSLFAVIGWILWRLRRAMLRQLETTASSNGETPKE